VAQGGNRLTEYNMRWVLRALHRNEHLDEIAAALNQRGTL
jgi:hypothetical protein